MNVLITGTSQGIGEAIATALLAKGHKVIGVGRTVGQAKNGLQQFVFDFSNPQGLMKLWEDIIQEDSCPETVVLNAGCGDVRSLEEQDYENCLKVVQVNFLAPYMISQIAAQFWRRREMSGHIIYIGSQAGLPGYAQPFNSLYSATKAALHSLVGSLARELGPLIRVNGIAPGDVKTNLALAGAKAFIGKTGEYQSLEDYSKKVSARAALKRWVEPGEVAQGVLYLMENQAVTGSLLNISAGTTIY